MDKLKKAAPFFLGLVICLTGCGIQDEEANNKKLNTAKPLGYYSNEHHEDNKGGNARVLDGEDNDGPITEIMDHTYGEEGNQRDYQARNINNVNNNNDTINWNEGAENDRNDNNINDVYDTDLAGQIENAAEKVNNVQDVRTAVYGDRVIVAIQVKDNKNKDDAKQKTNEVIKPLINNKNVDVVTDKGIFSGIEDINKKIRDGQPEKTISNSFDNLFHTIHGK
ncbi:YhcN/YlaJ family sporulation lipoprotein [Niallia sp. 03133]|uniref:YhcN/YlaJ family sporulation lipoprotein n=1 Tax=Niallia sp. 03133 TaxID=3458060 RepID=UPI00404495FE